MWRKGHNEGWSDNKLLTKLTMIKKLKKKKRRTWGLISELRLKAEKNPKNIFIYIKAFERNRNELCSR